MSLPKQGVRSRATSPLDPVKIRPNAGGGSAGCNNARSGVCRVRRRPVLISTWTNGYNGSQARLRPKSYIDYEALLRLHIRSVLRTRPLGAIVQFDIQSIYAQMFERGLSARTIEYANAVLPLAK